MGSVADAVTDTVGSIFGGDSRDAADAQVDAGREAARVQREIFQQTREDLAPYRLTGGQALYSLADLYGIPRPTSIVPESIQQDEMNPQARRRGPSGEGFGGVNRVIRNLDGGGRFDDVIDFTSRRGGLFGIGPRGLAGGVGEMIRQQQTGQRSVEAPQPTGDQYAPPGDTFADGGYQFTDPGSRQENAMSRFFTSPGYNFRLDQGVEAIERANAARGRLDSGATLQDLSRFGQGLASQEFNNYANRLASLAGVGQTGAAQTAQAGQNFAGMQSDILTGIGNARASGYVGQGNAIRGLLGSGMQLGGTLGAAALMGSDRRLKRDISHVGETPGGLPLYHFRYNDSDQWYEGVMADDVEQVNPDAVVEIDGYKYVDYSKVH